MHFSRNYLNVRIAVIVKGTDDDQRDPIHHRAWS